MKKLKIGQYLTNLRCTKQRVPVFLGHPVVSVVISRDPLLIGHVQKFSDWLDRKFWTTVYVNAWKGAAKQQTGAKAAANGAGHPQSGGARATAASVPGTPHLGGNRPTARAPQKPEFGEVDAQASSASTMRRRLPATSAQGRPKRGLVRRRATKTQF